MRSLFRAMPLVLCACGGTAHEERTEETPVSIVQDSTTADDTTADANVFVYGRIRDAETGEGMRTFHVHVSDADSRALIDSATVVDDSASYELVLDYGTHYLLQYSAPGYTAKSMRVDLRGIPAADHPDGFGMGLDVRLVEALDGVDYSVLDEPLGTAAYRSDELAIVWDSAYMVPRKAAVSALMEQQARVRSRLPKR